MEPFSLEKYLENPSRKVVTRNGRLVRIVCWDSPNKTFPIVGFIDNNPTVFVWDNYGYSRAGHVESKDDLFFADEEQESIEIPFGAKDSEFVRDEYLIPEGCEARIEGNKVIIERLQKKDVLSEFEKAIYQYICTIVNACDGEIYGDKELKPIVKEIAKDLLDLARKEVEQKAINHTYAYQNGYENGKYDALKIPSRRIYK